jgi:transcriptional regulator with XRE-family HTH domain
MNARFGSNARAARLKRGMTLDALACEAGLSKGHLSRFERGEKSLSIGALIRLSEALDTPVAVLLGESESGQAYHLVRAGGRDRMQASRKHGGYSYTTLSAASDSSRLSAFLVDVPAGASRGSPVAHAGEEIVYVISGRVEAALAGETIVLEQGDYLQFVGSRDHTMRGIDRMSQILIVVAIN